MKHAAILIALAALLAGCTDTKKDYDASANCQASGLKPGTPEYDKCVKDEKTVRLMEQQRREYEQMKQEQEDWKLRRY